MFIIKTQEISPGGFISVTLETSDLLKILVFLNGQTVRGWEGVGVLFDRIHIEVDRGKNSCQIRLLQGKTLSQKFREID